MLKLKITIPSNLMEGKELHQMYLENPNGTRMFRFMIYTEWLCEIMTNQHISSLLFPSDPSEER